MRLRFRPALAVIACMSLAVTACGSSDPGVSSTASGGVTASGGLIVVGFPADLSSTYAYYDVPMKEGAQMAVDEINEAGGVLGSQLKLDVVDQRNDPAESSKVTQQMIDDGAV